MNPKRLRDTQCRASTPWPAGPHLLLSPSQQEEHQRLPKAPPSPWKRLPASLPATVSCSGCTGTLSPHAFAPCLAQGERSAPACSRAPVEARVRRSGPALPCARPAAAPPSAAPARPLKDCGRSMSGGAGPPAGGGRGAAVPALRGALRAGRAGDAGRRGGAELSLAQPRAVQPSPA